MNENEYIETRLDDQIEWYDKKSKYNQKWFKIFRFIEILAAAVIPFLSGYISEDTLAINYTIGILGIIIALVAGLIGLLKLDENWIQYRTTCESLKHEKFLFATGVEPYDVKEPFKLLVQRVEALISRENSKWEKYVVSQEKREDEAAEPTGTKIG